MKNKTKRIIASICIAATAITVCSAGVFALDFGNGKESAKSSSSESSFTQEEKNAMIEKRKADKQKYKGMTDEEFFISIGREDFIEKQRKIQEECANDKENERFYSDAKKADNDFVEAAARRMDCAVDLVKRYGYYPDGVDTARIDSDEDYMLDFIINVCKAYSEHKNELTSSEVSTIETYLNKSYDYITSWYPQSEKSMDAYEMIEKTIEVQYYNTSVERR